MMELPRRMNEPRMDDVHKMIVALHRPTPKEGEKPAKASQERPPLYYFHPFDDT